VVGDIYYYTYMLHFPSDRFLLCSHSRSLTAAFFIIRSLRQLLCGVDPASDGQLPARTPRRNAQVLRKLRPAYAAAREGRPSSGYELPRSAGISEFVGGCSLVPRARTRSTRSAALTHVHRPRLAPAPIRTREDRAWRTAEEAAPRSLPRRLNAAAHPTPILLRWRRRSVVAARVSRIEKRSGTLS